MVRQQPVVLASALALLLAGAPPALAYGNKTAHPTINDLAEDLFYIRTFPKLSATYDKKYELATIDKAFPKLNGLTFINSGYVGVSSAEDFRQYSYYGWIERGGHDADEPELYMSFRHFYDPVLTPRFLTDHLPDSTYPNPNIDARTWALDHPDNRYSWSKALLLYKAAMENTTAAYSAYGKGREELFAAAFRAVGETMHLVADMALPAHVRDDSHPYSDPYEDTLTGPLIREIVGTACESPAGPAIPDGVVTSDQTPGELMSALSAYTNRTFFSDETISDKTTGILPARSGPGATQATKVYDSPQISTLAQEGNIYYATIMGRQVPLAQESLLGATIGGIVWAGYRSPAALARKQGEILVPLAVVAGSEVINAFFPKITPELTVTSAKTAGVYTLKATLTFAGTRAWQEAGLTVTYNGPVQILKNGVQAQELQMVNGTGSVDVTGWKVDDQVQMVALVGGMRIESPVVKIPDDFLLRLQACDTIHVVAFQAVRKFITRYTSATEEWRDTNFDIGNATDHKFPEGTTAVWSGSGFTMKGTRADGDWTTTLSINGSVDVASKTLSAHCQYSSIGPAVTASSNSEFIWIYDVTGLPVTDATATSTFNFSASGDALAGKVTTSKAAMWNPGAMTGSWGDYAATDWTGTIPDAQSTSTKYKPNLTIVIYKK